MWLVQLVFFSFLLVLTLAHEEVNVDIPQGTLKGLKTTTVYHGMPMYTFKGIPYAKPNIGPNKFKAPEAAGEWDGVWDATKHRDECNYFCAMRQRAVGDDDCLFVNVYTPDPNKNAKKAVMVFFHLGGFNMGSGDDVMYGADFLVEKDVVVVTFNYRLGALGFIATGDAAAPGNVGMKDQVMLLKWVKNNINNFGGCSNRITLFGHNCGAASVMYHMISPMSTGLFKRAIVQSGSILNSWMVAYKQMEHVTRLAEKVGVTGSSNEDLIEKLAAVSSGDLAVASYELEFEENVLATEKHLFVPVVEPDVGQEIFLPADPWEMIRSRNIADIPLIIGMTSQEAAFLTGPILQMAPDFQDHFDLFLHKDLNMTDMEMRKMTGNMIKEFYFKGKNVDESYSTELGNLMSDSFFIFGISMSSKIINSRNTSPVYQYLFDFEGSMGFLKTPFKMDIDGVIHGDDLSYLFYSTAMENKPKPGSREDKMTETMLEMWTNFAKEGNPSATMDFAKVMWEPMGDDGLYLDINDELTMKKSILQERVSFWANIYKNNLGDYIKLFN